MSRRLALALSLGLVTTGLMALGPAQPAAATDVCAGTGTITVGAPGLLAPLMPLVNILGTHLRILLLQDSLETLPFVLFTTTGACTPDLSTIAADGFVNGYCGHSGGLGTDNDGHGFGWVNVGTIILFTGDLTGIGTVLPNPLIANNSCFTGHPNREGALTIEVVFVVSRTNCTGGWTLIPFLTLVSFPVPVTGLPILSQSLLSVLINIHSDGVLAFHLHGFVHFCTSPAKL